MHDISLIESPYAWSRLVASLLLMTIAGSGMYAVIAAIPTIQLEFHLNRADASLPFALIMIGFGFGGVLMGRLMDRFGIVPPIVLGTVMLSLGFVAAGKSVTFWQFALAHGVLIGLLGSSATFAPLLADISHWFVRRRGIAVAICACGNYLAGAIWPPTVQHFITTVGWRETYIGLGLCCLVTMLPLSLVLRRRLVTNATEQATAQLMAYPARPLGLSKNGLTAVLFVAGISCCVAMSMPQVHLVALCSDLGLGAARGAKMLSLMLGLGVISRLASGLAADRLGGLRTLIICSTAQGLALLMFLPAKGLVSLYLVAALFGLFQGGIVPTYAIIIREYFPPAEAGARVGLVMMATLLGMALGGWMSGKIYDWTGNYTAAFVNGIGWNLLNVSLVCFLLWQRYGRSGDDAHMLRGQENLAQKA